jgi:hypothetical protein
MPLARKVFGLGDREDFSELVALLNYTRAACRFSP